MARLVGRDGPAAPRRVDVIRQGCARQGVPGLAKCATSSLHLLLIQHPGIFMCDPKEPHFFSTDLPGLAEVPDRAGYDALFAEAPAGVKRGDASAFYLSSRSAAEEIHKANPDARIIASIRNPVDAAVSLYHQLRDGFREDRTSFAEAWAMQEARARGEALPSYCPEPRQLQYRDVYSYHDQIARYFDVFGRDAVKVFRDHARSAAASGGRVHQRCPLQHEARAGFRLTLGLARSPRFALGVKPSDQRRQPDQRAIGGARRRARSAAGPDPVQHHQVELAPRSPRQIELAPLALLEPVIDHHPGVARWMIARLMLKGVSVPISIGDVGALQPGDLPARPRAGRSRAVHAALRSGPRTRP
jgi:hypothetical protein